MRVRAVAAKYVLEVSEPSKHLNFTEKTLSLEILAFAPNDGSKWKILEVFFISKYIPGFNEQGRSRKLSLFSNGVT